MAVEVHAAARGCPTMQDMADGGRDVMGMVASGPTAAALRAVRDDGCALTIWRRTLDPGFAASLDALVPEDLDDVLVETPVDGTALHVAASLGAAGYPVPVAAMVAADVDMLAAAHAAIDGWSSLVVRLDWVETDSCRRFHADMVATRLLTTYVGRGTQWRYAGRNDEDAETLGTGDVAVFKGRLLAPDAPILHRSPPIAGTGERRLLLVIDGPPTNAADRAGRA